MGPTPEDADSGAVAAPAGRGIRVVVGLGNPGPEYRETRHNLGFRVVERLVQEEGLGPDRLVCRALVVDRRRDLLVRPATFMNRSGYAVRCLRELCGFEPEDVLVVLDDVHLPLGRLRLRTHGSSGGHRGLESILENLRSDRVQRLRIGIAPAAGPPPGEQLAEFVLSPFAEEERALVEPAVERAARACAAWLDHGVERARSALT